MISIAMTVITKAIAWIAENYYLEVKQYSNGYEYSNEYSIKIRQTTDKLTER